MTQVDRALPQGTTGEKMRVLRVRRLIGDLADRVPDRERARRLEADLNDAWLCLQLARVSDDPALSLSRARAYTRLLYELLKAAEVRGDGGQPGPTEW